MVTMIRSLKGYSGLWRKAAQAFTAVLGLSATATLALPACSSDDAAAEPCKGVVINGECQKKCDVADCVSPATMKCVGNTCAQTCADATKDCPAGKYCYGTNDDTGAAGQFCFWAPFTDGGKQLGQYDTTCTVDTECDELRGYKCLGGTCKLTGCTLNSDCAGVPGLCVKDPSGDPTKNVCEKSDTPALGLGKACTKSTECDSDLSLGCVEGVCAYVGCTTHADCATVGECKTAKNAEGKDVLACAAGKTYPKGQFGSKCTNGTNAECDEANGFVCIGAGPGDIEAYCTKTGCGSDDDCGAGYSCNTVRTGRKPCVTACGLTGVGGNPPSCVSAAELGPGKEFSCGPITLLRKLCLKREFCGDCKSDEDCRAIPGQICASDGKGHKYCSAICDPNVSNACPWGTAAECAVHDTALGKPTCAHRFGACKGTGKGCEPCRDDADCPTGLCLSTDYGGEHYCLDLGPKCDCTGLPVTQNVQCTDGGCPKAPSGITMNCYGGSAIKSSGSPLYQTCLGADSLQGKIAPYSKPGCWPPQ